LLENKRMYVGGEYSYSAITVAELGELLGIHSGEPWRPQYAEETEADYRAGHLIYLVENKSVIL